MSRNKYEVFLSKEEIEFLKTISSNRSEAIRTCVDEKMEKKNGEIRDEKSNLQNVKVVE